MPARAENINAFDLKLLKALVNFKINKDHRKELAVHDKRKLCKSYSTNGILTISHSYLIKMWPKGKEINNKVSLATLDQLSGILKKDYRWNLFADDIARFRPSDINGSKPYSLLSTVDKEKVDMAIEEIFKRYKTFEEFEKEVIDKIEIVHPIKENKIPLGLNEPDEIINAFIHRVYIELSTRKAAIPIDKNEDVIEEIYDSWYKLFCIIRDDMKSLPVVYFKKQGNASPAIKLANEILNEVLRPHLTKYQAKYRSWLDKEKRNPKNRGILPQELQKKYPDFKSLIKSMKEVNVLLMHASNELYCLIK